MRTEAALRADRNRDVLDSTVLRQAYQRDAIADVRNLNIDYAFKLSEDRELRRSIRPSLRCQPLLGGVAIKEVIVFHSDK